MAYHQGAQQGSYPDHYQYSNQPYAFPPSPNAEGDFHSLQQPQYPYSSQDYISPERDGAGIAGGRQTYPPERDGDESVKFAGAGGFDEKGVPVTRGSIAAQMAAEGQIPKKEGLRMWRKDEHAGALTRGGRARCCGRVCCCSIMLVVLIIIGIVAAFFLWVKPPDVSFGGVEDPSTGSIVTVASGGFNLNFRLKIDVINPNFFGADFKQIDATAYYPLKPTTAFGGGSMTDVSIKKNSNTTVHFPFAVNYTTSYDSDLSVLKDIATKCGFLGSSTSQLTVNYKVKTKVKVIAITIDPSFSSSASFDCPLDESDLTDFLGSDSLSSLGLSALTGSSRERRALEGGAPTSAPGMEKRSLAEREAYGVGLATRNALRKVAERGLEVLLAPRGGDQMFDATRRYRVGTVG